MSNRINDSMGESRTTLLRVGVLVAIAALVADRRLARSARPGR